jgi:hypothetical protein
MKTYIQNKKTYTKFFPENCGKNIEKKMEK